jgi:hypothetical protein
VDELPEVPTKANSAVPSCLGGGGGGEVVAGGAWAQANTGMSTIIPIVKTAALRMVCPFLVKAQFLGEGSIRLRLPEVLDGHDIRHARTEREALDPAGGPDHLPMFRIPRRQRVFQGALGEVVDE